MSLPHFQTGHVPQTDGGQTPYVLIGQGPIPMVVVPGAADGLRTCVEVSLSLAWFYRSRARRCRLLVLSRREPMLADFGIERHADDMIGAVEQLGFGPAVWECLSAGGPIGQWVAVKRPDLVRGLILSSSYDYVAPVTRKSLRQWLDITAHREGIETLTAALAQKYLPPPGVLAELDPAGLEKPVARGPERVTRILSELLDLDQRDLVKRVACPTLIVGGQDDRVVPAQVQQEMAARIPTSSLELYAGYGHFNDMENPAYQERVEEFARQVTLAEA
jgi:pimeloyl-ACP methyl ester carboxylesterase